MAKQKTHYALILFLITLVVLSCKRTEKELTTVEFEVVNPVTCEGYPGVPVRIYLRDFGNYFSNSSGNNTETDVFWEGVTDENGKAVHTFNAYKNSRYGYVQQIDINYFSVQNGKYSATFSADHVVEKNEYNHALHELVPYADYYVHTKNVNCEGANDKMRYRLKSLYTQDPGSDFTDWAPSPVVSSGYVEGCYDGVSGLITNRSDSVIYELEVTRNGTTEIITKKFYRDPNKVDTLKLYY